MLRRWIHRWIAKLEQAYRYDASYLHEVTDASLPAFLKFVLFQSMSMHRESVPKEAWFAARMAGTLSEDCGPCTQLMVDEALRQKISPLTIAALLRGDIDEAGADAALGFRYGTAVAKNAPESVSLAEDIERRYGKRGLVSLAYAVASARVYPALKRGLGHGAACTRIIVSDQTVVLKEAA